MHARTNTVQFVAHETNKKSKVAPCTRSIENRAAFISKIKAAPSHLAAVSLEMFNFEHLPWCAVELQVPLIFIAGCMERVQVAWYQSIGRWFCGRYREARLLVE